jgi:Lsr2
MAKKTIVEWIDDIDGAEASETVGFSLDGCSYEIDLSGENAAQLRGVMRGWIDASRRSAQHRGPGIRSKGAGADQAQIRKWALDNGFDVGPRGPLRTEILRAFNSRSS